MLDKLDKFLKVVDVFKEEKIRIRIYLILC